MEVETAINIAIIAITPYSAGVNKRASTNPTKKAIPELAMLSIKLHPTPRTVLCLNVSDNHLTPNPFMQTKYIFLQVLSRIFLRYLLKRIRIIRNIFQLFYDFCLFRIQSCLVPTINNAIGLLKQGFFINLPITKSQQTDF